MTTAQPMFPPPQRKATDTNVSVEGAAIPLSALFVMPALADAFARAEREPAGALTVPAPSSVAPASEASVRPPHDAGGTFDENLRRLSAAANLAYALAVNPTPIPALLHGACAGADPSLGRDLLAVVEDGLEIGQAVVELMAAVRRGLEEVVR
jgi:hypothetical protein